MDKGAELGRMGLEKALKLEQEHTHTYDGTKDAVEMAIGKAREKKNK